MIDLTRVDRRLYDTVTPIIDELVDAVEVDPVQIMLVGATCRDILHAGFGHSFAVRATTDVDLGIAVSDWQTSDRIDERYRRIGSNGIRYRIAGTPVDVMPFGGIENPEGISSPSARGRTLSCSASETSSRSPSLCRSPTVSRFACLTQRVTQP